MKHVPLLPNLVTTGNLLCGFLSLVCSLRGDLIQAAWFVLAAMIFDFFDGQIARLQKTSSEFGVEYDSLCDLLSFGVAPAVLVYQLVGHAMGRIGVAVAFLYVACTALRLARYNVGSSHTEKRAFLGLPSPAAAGFVCSTIILEKEIPEIYSEMALIKLLPFLLLLAAVLMVSNIRYPAIKSVNTFSARPFMNLVLVVAGGALIVFQLEVFVFLCFLLYVLAGMWEELHLQHLKRKLESKLHGPI